MNESYVEMTKRQKEDFKTNKIREDIKISLTDEKYFNLKRIAYNSGFKDAASFLSSFIGDLTGWQANGSDERELADHWYERAFGLNSEYYASFRHHLFINDHTLEDMSEMLEDEDYFTDIFRAYLEENEDKEEFETKNQCKEVLKEILEKGIEL